ncbi:hypothetical protein DFH28DRAFT_1119921 [Melampsora americana]|nr:hypothetical protein DFH28DRAFT_1119921 [Melampsora americana]
MFDPSLAKCRSNKKPTNKMTHHRTEIGTNRRIHPYKKALGRTKNHPHQQIIIDLYLPFNQISSILQSQQTNKLEGYNKMSFPKLFDSLDLANHGSVQNRTQQSTPALDGSVIDFEDAYGNTTQEPIVIDSTTTTPAADPLANIEIDSNSSVDTERDHDRSQAYQQVNQSNQIQSNEVNRLTENSENQSAQAQTNYTNQSETNTPHRAKQAQPAQGNHQEVNVASNRAPVEQGGPRWGNYSIPYQHQTQQQQAGYDYQPRYHPDLAAPVSQYPPAPVSIYNANPHYIHQPTPTTSNTLPPPPPPQPSYQQTRDAEEARLRQAIIDLKRNLDEARVANNNANFRQVLGMVKEAHKELEDFLGGRRHRQKVESVADYNPYHLNPKTMEPFENPRSAGPSSQRRKRAKDDEIDELAENTSNLLDMILVVKRMKRDDQDPNPKGKGKEREQIHQNGRRRE